MRIELINCEGAVLKCTVGRFNVSILAFLLDGQGYIKFIPRLEHLYKYLLGHLTLENILESAEEIKINNVVYDFKEIDLSNIYSVNNKITDHSEQDLDIKSLAKLIAKVESRLFKKRSLDRLGINDAKMTHYSKSPLLWSVVKSIRKMDTLKLADILDEDGEYMDTNIYIFLAKLRDKFEEFKKNGDTALYAQKIKEDVRFLGSYVFRFKGNKSTMEYHLGFQIINEETIKIKEYKI